MICLVKQLTVTVTLRGLSRLLPRLMTQKFIHLDLSLDFLMLY